MGEFIGVRDMNEKENGMVRFIIEQHTRLSAIIRYNNTPKINGESVAEHSYYVTFAAMLVGDYLTAEHGLPVDRLKLMKMALLHDVEEIISGDIIKILKSGGFKEELEKMNKRSMEYLTGTLDKQLAQHYYDLWAATKSKDSLEAKLLDFVDLLVVIIYSIRECHLGNKYFLEILEYAAHTVFGFKEVVPELSNFIDEVCTYALGYLANDPGITARINSAVRIDTQGKKE